MNMNDVYLFSAVGVVIVLLTVVFFRGLTVLSFDEEFSQAIGFPNPWLRLILSVTTVITVAMGVQAVGVVLMSALLITPAASARFWTNSVPFLAILSIAISGASGVLGSAISYTYAGMPTGPWIVVVVSIVAFSSAIIGTRNGLGRKMLLRWSNNRKILRENTIKLFYNSEHEKAGYSLEELLTKSSMQASSLTKGLRMLMRLKFVTKESGEFITTDEGAKEARAIVRKHRLWELYISRFMNLQPDHVHDDAEGIEHVITPEIEKELEKELEYPLKDPHDSEIPYE